MQRFHLGPLSLIGYSVALSLAAALGCAPAISEGPSPGTQESHAAEDSPDATASPPAEEPAHPQDQDGQPVEETASRADADIVLFDGSNLDNWEVTNYGGEGECRIEDGNLIVEMGSPISGMNSVLDDLPTTNYEISLEAKRVDGIDFFCGLTFPVDDSHCTLIVGGWAGSLVGLSCLDEKDASDNETKTLMSFDNDHWYRIRVAVRPDRIQCWIDDEQVVDVATTGRKISLRAETLPSRPLGISSFQTTAAYRKIEIRNLDE